MREPNVAQSMSAATRKRYHVVNRAFVRFHTTLTYVAAAIVAGDYIRIVETLYCHPALQRRTSS
ncbi:MAG: hypothetical protein NUW01_13580 [Gemmatimonadaceae bacterium]|nr:hypothetical protein [Gemmatimonadaceae bacterium]